MLSSAQRQNCGNLLTDNNVAICAKTKVWSTAPRQKCVHLPTKKVWSSANIIPATHNKGGHMLLRHKCGRTTQSIFYAWTCVTIGSAKCTEYRVWKGGRQGTIPHHLPQDTITGNTAAGMNIVHWDPPTTYGSFMDMLRIRHSCVYYHSAC